MGKRAFHAYVCGRVQGVGFRWSAYDKARALHIGGWVRNHSDGRVEVLAEGEETQLAAFKAWLSKGPPGAWVESVESSELAASGLFPGFSIED